MKRAAVALGNITRQSLSRTPPLARVLGAVLSELLISGLLGALIALAAALFVAGTRLFSGLQLGWHGFQFNLLGLTVHPTIFLSLSVAALALFYVRHLFKMPRWFGPADTIHAAHAAQLGVDVPRGIASTLAAFISIAGGASVGQFGPLVHFGATLGTALRRAFGGRLHREVVLGCGVAAAISAGFEAPLAGIVFAHEAVLRRVSLRALGPLSIASVTATAITRFAFEPPRIVPLAFESVGHLHLVLLPLLGAGLWFGLVAVVFMNAMRTVAAYGQTNGMGWQKNMLLAIAGMGVTGALVPQVTGLGGATILQIISGHMEISLLLALLLGKILATSLSLGLGFFGGVFSPALVVGAAAGGVCALVFAGLGLSGLGPVMVLAGMAAVAASVVGAPLAAVLIVLELTGSYELTLAALIAVAGAVLISNSLFGRSFFDRQLLARGVDIAAGRGPLAAQAMPVSSLLSQDFTPLRASDSAAMALEQMRAARRAEAICVSAQGEFRGRVHLLDLLNAAPRAKVGRFVCPETAPLYHDDTVLTAQSAAHTSPTETIVVIDRTSGKLAGIVRVADILRAHAKLAERAGDTCQDCG